MNRRVFVFCCLALAGAPAMSQARSTEINSPGGLAIGGYDPVGYFVEARPVRGRADYALMWMGATWLFASADNRAAFEADPYRYAPAFGGYCAYSVSRGYMAASDPEAFAIEGGRLYLIRSQADRELWLQDVAGNIARAQANWPAILN